MKTVQWFTFISSYRNSFETYFNITVYNVLEFFTWKLSIEVRVMKENAKRKTRCTSQLYVWIKRFASGKICSRTDGEGWKVFILAKRAKGNSSRVGNFSPEVKRWGDVGERFRAPWRENAASCSCVKSITILASIRKLKKSFFFMW